MNKVLLIGMIVLAFTACKNDSKNNPVDKDNMDPRIEAVEKDSMQAIQNSEVEKNKEKEYPNDLVEVFMANGGLDKWNSMHNLCFEMKGKDGEEIHTISLPDRKTKITSKKWSMGYDGKNVWLLKNDPDYQGNPKFYHNLMFYFFAMPYVLGDPGTNYTALPPTELDGKMYNGYKVTYNKGIGDSSNDEYILFFDPQTHKMTWLAYTVTFGKSEQSADWHYIKYDKWQEVNGLQLPEKITWWNVENGKPHDERSDVHFDKISMTETRLDDSVFTKPSEAEFVK